MTKVSQFCSKEQINEEASLWISRMDRGLNPEEKQRLVAWINQNNSHHEALMKMASLWDDLSVLNELSGIFPLEEKPRNRSSFLTNIALAASFMIATVTGLNYALDINPLTIFQNGHESYSQTFQTKLGEQVLHSLPDGSFLQLNTNTQVAVHYKNNQRRLTLIQGEANFDVAKDKSRPFIVEVGEQSFTALGTAFNIQKKNSQDIELIVTEGKVLISHTNDILAQVNRSNDSPVLDSLPGLLVTGGEKSVVENNTLTTATKISPEQVQKNTAWQQGILIFDGDTLADALAEISRYNDTKFEVLDDEIASLKISGYFKAGDIDGLLSSLDFNFNIQ